MNNYSQQSAMQASTCRQHPHFSARVKLLWPLAIIFATGCGARSAQYRQVSSDADSRSLLQEESLGRRELTPGTPIGPSRLVTASWYGPGYDGHRTSSGERFNSRRLSAASRKLPPGTIVRVTNLENGRSADVTVNDHGPEVHGRGLDLSPCSGTKNRVAQKRIGSRKSYTN